MTSDGIALQLETLARALREHPRQGTPDSLDRLQALIDRLRGEVLTHLDLSPAPHANPAPR